MMLLSLLLFLMPLSLGFIFVCLFWPGEKPVRSNLLLKACLAVGAGTGIFSCLFFIWLLIFGPSRGGFAWTQIILFAGLLALLIYSVRASKDASAIDLGNHPPQRSIFRWLLLAILLIVSVFAIVSFILVSLKKPHGDWDAWAIWNLRARFLFRGGDRWTDAFSSLMARSHPDYPLLVPATIAGFWSIAGNDVAAVPVALSLLFTFGAVGLMVASLSLLRGKSQAVLGGLVLLGTPFFIAQGTAQYADVPLSFFFLATLALLALQDSLPDNRFNFMLLSGVMAGLAAWTKNEGLLFLAAVIVARFAVIVPAKGLKFYFRQMFHFAKGLAPALAVVVYFKIRLAPPNYLVASQGSQDMLGKLLDVARHLQVWEAFAKHITSFGGWPVSFPILLAFYFLLLGLRIEKKEKLTVAASMLTLCLMIAGYSLMLALSPYDLGWHLATSLDRLFLQLWPGFIFIYFLAVPSLEQTAARKGVEAEEKA